MEDRQEILQSSLVVRKSVSLIVIRLIVIEILVSILFVVIQFVYQFTSPFLGPENNSLLISIVKTLVFATIEISIIVALILEWAQNYYILRAKELTYVSGIFNRKEKTYALGNVQSVSHEQSFMGRILNFGDVKIFSPALQGDLYLLGVADPKILVENIKRATTEDKNRLNFLIKR